MEEQEDGCSQRAKFKLNLNLHKEGTMKHTKRLSIGLVGTVAIILAAGFLAAQQPPQKGEMKSMENMSMDKMMKECSEHH